MLDPPSRTYETISSWSSSRSKSSSGVSRHGVSCPSSSACVSSLPCASPLFRIWPPQTRIYSDGPGATPGARIKGSFRVETFRWSFPARSFLPFFMGLRVFVAICFPLGWNSSSWALLLAKQLRDQDRTRPVEISNQLTPEDLTQRCSASSGQRGRHWGRNSPPRENLPHRGARSHSSYFRQRYFILSLLIPRSFAA